MMNARVYTSVAEATDELIRRVRAKVDPTQVTVQDGPTKYGDWKPTVIVIGWSSADAPAFTVANSAPGGLRPNDSETWTIRCVVGAADGSTEGAVSKARAKVAAAMGVLHEVLVDDMTLGGTCGRAVLGNVDWFQTTPGKAGPEAILMVEIRGWAL